MKATDSDLSKLDSSGTVSDSDGSDAVAATLSLTHTLTHSLTHSLTLYGNDPHNQTSTAAVATEAARWNSDSHRAGVRCQILKLNTGPSGRKQQCARFVRCLS